MRLPAGGVRRYATEPPLVCSMNEVVAERATSRSNAPLEYAGNPRPTTLDQYMGVVSKLPRASSSKSKVLMVREPGRGEDWAVCAWADAPRDSRKRVKSR